MRYFLVLSTIALTATRIIAGETETPEMTSPPTAKEKESASSATMPQPLRYGGAMFGGAVGTEGTYTYLVPLGMILGRVWPERNWALDCRVNMGLHWFHLGIDSTATKVISVHGAVTPRVGGHWQPNWLHFIFPLSTDIYPARDEDETRFAVYFNLGAGIGYLKTFPTKRGYFGFDVSAVAGVNAGETFGENLALYPRWRIGVDAALYVGRTF